jgi:plastocyanin
MNAYVIAGAAFAVWAVLVSLAGMRGFPSNRGGQMLAIGVSLVLFVVAVGSAIGDTKKVGERKGKETEEKKPASEAAPAAPATPAAPSTPQTSTPAPAAPAGSATDLALSADPTGQLKFDKTTLEAKAGQVKITLTNPAPVPHNIAIKGPVTAGPSANVSAGKTADVSANLKPGTYEFYCAIPGHEQAGMKGTLTVK